jgi:serine/threonine protein kinase
VKYEDSDGKESAHFYLLFPWAKGDLWRFWKDNSAPEIRSKRTKWIAEQMFQIARALLEVHKGRVQSFPAFPDIEKKDYELYGRHGDIKAENILWIDTDSSNEDILVIIDFGLGRLHSKISRSIQNPKGIERTASYRAPEFDMADGKISRAADIYSLGCTFLEMVTWSLKGWEAVYEEFPQHRTQRDQYGFMADTFFEIVPDLNGTRTPQLKSKVKEWVEDLRKDSRCNQFFSGVLKVIEVDMLDPNPETRIKTQPLVEKLEVLAQECH